MHEAAGLLIAERRLAKISEEILIHEEHWRRCARRSSSLLLALCTGETRDVFEQAIAAADNSPIHGSLQEAERLENLKQLSLSGVWLVFSIAVMVFGIWRRTRQLRMMAIVLFGITILKIFIYDLSFLETLYRIFSFLGLGLILLAVSYLYQRYRGIILGPSDTAEV